MWTTMNESCLPQECCMGVTKVNLKLFIIIVILLSWLQCMVSVTFPSLNDASPSLPVNLCPVVPSLSVLWGILKCQEFEKAKMRSFNYNCLHIDFFFSCSVFCDRLQCRYSPASQFSFEDRHLLDYCTYVNSVESGNAAVVLRILHSESYLWPHLHGLLRTWN